MKLLFPEFKKNIERHELVRPGDTLILGFSGGKDSVTLALLLLELQKHTPFRLIAAYFNHRLRADAGDEEKWVHRFCAGRGIELKTGRRDVKRFREESGLNLEHAASLSRYDFFNALAAKTPGARIATAHSRSDLAETFFIKLFRGSGLQGLSAIFQNKEKKIIRPLLIFSEKEILAFLQRNRLECYQDPTNLQQDFLRNRIRHDLLPVINGIEPEIEERIFRTVLLIQDEFDHFQGEARAGLEANLLLGAILPARAFAGLHPAQARHLARECLRRLKGDLLGVGFEHIAGFLDSLDTGRGLSLPGLNLKFAKGWIFPEKIRIADYQLEITGPGAWPVAEIGRVITLKRTKRFRLPGDNSQVVFPEAKLLFPLRARSASATDKYRKIHSPYAQSVFEMIRSSGLPAPLRRLAPLLENGDGEILWVCGSPVAAPFAMDGPSSGPFVQVAVTP
ncbi:MAG: tRNA lysidine(34) synthetase TilS [Acidobacteria bacterium]|jgi:tRNA(Ile)-lysidine synthase|nr:tRNA lysidine(34) synthetase TilS [Acidobacteriota bacterium]